MYSRLSSDLVVISSYHRTGPTTEQFLPQNSSYHRTVNKYGGLAVYVNENVSFKEIDLQNFSKELVLELAAVELGDYGLVIVSVYRSLDGNMEEFFNLLLTAYHFSFVKGKM